MDIFNDDSNFDYLLNVMGQQLLINNISVQVLISNQKDKILDTKKIKTIVQFKTGDIVIFQGYSWLITSEVSKTNTIYKGFMRKCNENIKFKSSDSSIYTTPCIISGNEISILSTQSDTNFTIPKDVFVCKVQSNPYTKQIVEGMRFILDSEAYIIQGVSGLLEKGIIQFKLQKDLFRKNLDNVNGNGLADQSITVVQVPPVNLAITGSSTIKTNANGIYTLVNFNSGEKFTFTIINPLTGLTSTDVSITSSTDTTVTLKGGTVGSKSVRILATDVTNSTITASLDIKTNSGF